jgi:hypothetical protein
MATAQKMGSAQGELRTLAGHGATLGELLDHLDERVQGLGRRGFSDDQEEELQLYCWAAHKSQSDGSAWGETAVAGPLEDDIGA